jgi:hypothetical protein
MAINDFSNTLDDQVGIKKVHHIVRVMLQTIFYIADLNQNKLMLHGNVKEERIYMMEDGLRGYVD